MRHQRQRYQLSRSASHRKALLMNLSKEVIEHERIQTSEAKAKAVKPELEKLSLKEALTHLSLGSPDTIIFT